MGIGAWSWVWAAALLVLAVIAKIFTKPDRRPPGRRSGDNSWPIAASSSHR